MPDLSFVAKLVPESIALRLRFLQTMREISSEHNTTTFLPVPVDLFAPFLKDTEDVAVALKKCDL